MFPTIFVCSHSGSLSLRSRGTTGLMEVVSEACVIVLLAVVSAAQRLSNLLCPLHTL